MKATHTLWNAFSKPAPISRVEFSKALAKLWTPPLRSQGAQEATIGLAISGGVDSMALAVLCSQLQQYAPNLGIGFDEKKAQKQLLPELRFQAFVVDHDVRAGSDLEAQAVSKVLEERGIPTNVLKIQWPRSFNPKEKQGFESIARKYRFRILGKACRELRINSLLLAHHEDDQAETVFMRMLAGHRLAGLTGIRERCEIPENHGFYGVHESGGDLFEAEKETPKKKTTKHQLLYEEGGIQLYRPMLDFSKARLIATCEAEKMRWFEDHTNKDPSLTTRNAIRHLFANHKLPAALSKSSLLDLAATARGKLAMRKAIVDDWLSSDNVSSFETRAGTMTIRFPHVKNLEGSEKLSVVKKKQMAADLLKRILMFVTPEESIEVSSLHGAIVRLFPEIESRKPIENGQLQSATGFTIAGVQFQPQIPVLGGYEQFDESTSLQSSPKPKWFLSRQPLHSAPVPSLQSKVDKIQNSQDACPDKQFNESRLVPEIIEGKVTWSPNFGQLRISDGESEDLSSEPLISNDLDSSQGQLHISQHRTPKRILPASSSPEPPTPLSDILDSESPKNPRNIVISPTSANIWSPWALFDNRYWIRVLNPTAHALNIKHFRRAHLTSLRNTLPKSYRRYVQDLLRSVAPGDVRWTLPVLVKTERAWGWDSGQWRDQVVGLPTLGVSAFTKEKPELKATNVEVNDTEEVHGLENVEWEVRYKKVNLDSIPMSKNIRPSSAYAMDLQPMDAPTTTMKPKSKIGNDRRAMIESDYTQGEEVPRSRSSTKKKILKRVAWLKVRAKAIKKNEQEKKEKKEPSKRVDE